MKQLSSLFKILIILTGVFSVVGMIRFPQTEGRAANLELVNIYKDPFIIYLYIASIPFFISLYQAFKLVDYLNNRKKFSRESVKALNYMKYCAISFVGFMLIAVMYVFSMAKSTNEDGAGAIALGILIILCSGVVAALAAHFQKALQNTRT